MNTCLKIVAALVLLATLGACVVVPGGPRRAYYGPPVVAPVGVFYRARC